MESTSAILYPVITENALMIGIEAFERTLSQTYLSRPKVRAAGHLGKDSFTEVIDVNKLSQKSTSEIQYVEIADAQGLLYCTDSLISASCWLKIVTIANDYQSSNVLLISANKGVILKTLKEINPGEPLLMWFTINVQTMMNIPFLKPHNIQGQNRYICHICDKLFEYPNPLKIHLGLKCSRLENNYFWSLLAKEFNLSLKSNLSKSSFKFKLTKSSQVASNRTSPTTVQTTNITDSTNNDSPQSSNQISPCSSNSLSSDSLSSQILPNSSTPQTSTRKDIPHRHSAFKPYTNENRNISPPIRNETVLTPYNVETTVPPMNVSTDIHAAQMETIASNLGKSRQGHLCIYCGKIYSRKYGLKIHIRTHTGYKPLKCKYCLRPFGDPSNLNKHVRLHTDGETPYKCALCGKVLVRRRDLERHLKSRHEENRDTDQTSDTSSDETDV